MFKNALVYRIEHWEKPTLSEIENRLSAARFVECGPTQPLSVGWVAPRGEPHAPLVEAVGGQWVLQLCAETRAVPGGVVKTQLQAQLNAVEQQTGRRPKGKHARELKEAVVHALLPRAFPRRADTRVWVDPSERLVWVSAGSTRKADAVLTQLVEGLGGELRLSLLQTELAPATAMAAWLAEREAPAGFSIDRECELKQPDAEKASVRYSRHTLDIDEVAEHIRQGKRPTQLALTWAGRVSFVLTEALTLKKIQWLDLALEGAGTDEGGFDADVALATGELRQLLPALVAALGGLQERQTGVPPAPGQETAVAADETAPWDIQPA